MRKISTGFAALVVLLVVAQFFLAASGAFDSAPNEESFGMHRALGYGIILVAILSTIVAALGRMPGRLVGMAGLVAALAVVQSLIRAVAGAFDETAGELVFGLHAVNGLIVLAVAARVARQAWALSRPTVPDRPAAEGGAAA